MSVRLDSYLQRSEISRGDVVTKALNASTEELPQREEGKERELSLPLFVSPVLDMSVGAAQRSIRRSDDRRDN